MSKTTRELNRNGRKSNGTAIRVTETAMRELKSVASDVYLLLDDIVAEIGTMPMKYAVDSADNLSVCGVDLSWIKDNRSGRITIITREEALHFDRISNKCLN